MILATLCLQLLALPGQPASPGPIPWRSDLDDARKEATGKGLPLLVVFR